jgi:putative DNA primase/helicase
MKAININPQFEDLNNSETLLNHVQELTKLKEATLHAEILHKLIEQIEPIDFEVLAFPEVKQLRK